MKSFILFYSIDQKKIILRKYELLGRDELTIEWKPIYDLYLRVHKIDECSSNLAPE